MINENKKEYNIVSCFDEFNSILDLASYVFDQVYSWIPFIKSKSDVECVEQSILDSRSMDIS